MIDRYTVIQELERCARGQCDICQSCNGTGFPDGTLSYKCAWHDELVQNAIDLLKTHDLSIEELANDYGLTIDGVRFALEQYQTVICEITHSRMSKLSYFAKDIIQLANEMMCEGCELQEAQKPRVMALEEVKRFVYGTPYIIETNLPHDEPRLMYGLYSHQGTNGCFYFAFTDARSHFFDADYGERWRCWTSKPTKAQREATPWN